jgi:hypothetical protein
MKKKSLFVQMTLIVFTLISINVWAGNEESFNSSYKISPDLNFEPTSDFEKCWEIAYDESQQPVHVFMKETKKGQEYLVRTKYFELKYINGSNGFGVRVIDGSEATVTKSLNDAVINSSAFSNQKCISNTAIENDKVLEMIASYLPDLINEQYKSILN